MRNGRRKIILPGTPSITKDSRRHVSIYEPDKLNGGGFLCHRERNVTRYSYFLIYQVVRIKIIHIYYLPKVRKCCYPYMSSICLLALCSPQITFETIMCWHWFVWVWLTSYGCTCNVYHPWWGDVLRTIRTACKVYLALSYTERQIVRFEKSSVFTLQ